MTLLLQYKRIAGLLANPDLSPGLREELKSELEALDSCKPTIKFVGQHSLPDYQCPLDFRIVATIFTVAGPLMGVITDANDQVLLRMPSGGEDREAFEHRVSYLTLLLESGLGIEKEMGVLHE